MRPALRRLLEPTGIPRNGLAGMWIPALDFDARNLLAWSADLTNALWVATDATKDAATLLTFTAQNGNVYRAITTVAGRTYTLSFKARAVSGNTALRFLHTNSATGDSTALTVNGTLTQYSVSVLGKTGSGLVNFGIQDQNAAGQGQIEITEFQVNIGSLQPYNQTTDKQVLFDRSGYNNHGQLGATTGAEASDPIWQPAGLSMTGSNYVLSGGLPVDMAGEWTMYLCAKFTGITNSTAMGLAEFAGSNDQHQRLIYTGTAAGTMSVQSRSGATTNTASGNIPFDPTVYTLAIVKLKSGTLMCINTSTNAVISVASLLPTGPCRVGIGALPRLIPLAIADLLQCSFAAIYARATSPEEDRRVHRELRRMLAPAGITLP